MARQSALRVWEVCEPHRDVFSRDPDPSLFAISLHHVMRGSADRDYTDPERFFARTCMTRALSNLLQRVLGRLAGQGRGAPVLRLETPFGGGKTHTMTALWHIARYPEVCSEQESLRPILEALNLRSVPNDLRVAVLDGRGLDARERRTDDGLTVRTLWGELAYQLGGRTGYEMLADADQTRTSPGGALLTELLRRYQPALILMDEVLDYLIKARAVSVGSSNLMEQTGTFLGELTSAVSAVPQSALVLALPASSLEIPAENQESAERLFQYAKKVLGRMELVETPVAQDEVFEVLRRRLFQRVAEERDRKKAVEAFRAYYEEYARFFPDRLRSPDYRERMLQAYPFHPELVDLLYERWGPHPQFQRTRGALRLLALVLRRIWQQRPGSALLIQPHHIDLHDRHIRGEVVRLLDSSWEAIVTGDVLRRAEELERQLGGEYSREQLARGTASAAFVYSISAATRDVGATEEEIRTALLRPSINPAMVSEVLGRLRERLWYLRYRDHRYFFTAKPNLNKVILDFENEVTDEQVEKALRERITQCTGKAGEGFQLVIAPAEPKLVPDRAQPTLVVLPPDVHQPQQWMEQAVQAAESGIRVNKNMLIFLVPEPTQISALRSAIRRWLALKAVSDSHSFKEMDSDDREQVKLQLKDKEAELEALLRRTYQEIYRPSNGSVKRITGIGPETIKAKTLAAFVEETLRNKGELVDSVAPEYLKDVLRIDQQQQVPLAQVSNLFTGVTSQPVLRNPEEAVRRTVQQGVQQGLFAVRVGEQVYSRQEVPDDILKRKDVVLVPPPDDKKQPPPPPAQPKPLTLRVRTSASVFYPITVVAKQLQQLNDATIVLEVRDPSGKLSTMQAEIDKLVRDYGCTCEWVSSTE